MTVSEPGRNLLASELGPEERLLWCGRPDPVASVASKWSMALFAVPWLFFTVTAFLDQREKGEIGGAIFLLLFVGVGLWLLLHPLLEYQKARRTIAGITDKRLLVVRTHSSTVTSIKLSGVRQVERVSSGRKITLRIPTALVSGESGPKVEYLELAGLSDGDRAYRLLTDLGG